MKSHWGCWRCSKKQREVMTLQDNVELLDVYNRLRSAATVAHLMQVLECSGRTTVSKGKGKP